MNADVIDSIIPNFMKHFSVGASFGVVLGILITLNLSKYMSYIFLGMYILVGLFGLWRTRDDWVEYFQK